MSNHQFSLFGFQTPKKKIPISKERIQEVKDLIAKGDHKSATQRLRDVRYRLEDYERRL